VGDSKEEVEQLIREAVAFHIKGLRDEGLPIPSPTSSAGVLTVDPAA